MLSTCVHAWLHRHWRHRQEVWGRRARAWEQTRAPYQEMLVIVESIMMRFPYADVPLEWKEALQRLSKDIHAGSGMGMAV